MVVASMRQMVELEKCRIFCYVVLYIFAFMYLFIAKEINFL